MLSYIFLTSGLIEIFVKFVFFKTSPPQFFVLTLPTSTWFSYYLLQGVKQGGKTRNTIIQFLLFLGILGPLLYIFNIWYNNWQTAILNTHLEEKQLAMLEFDYLHFALSFWYSFISALTLIYVNNYKKLLKKDISKK
jgi:hypothetical protein